MSGKVVDEFNTNVPDKEERKRLRKKRTEKINTSEVTNHDEFLEKDTGTNRTGSQQIADSLFHLDLRKHGGLQDVTSIRVATNDIEAKRRVDDEELRRNRLSKLQQENLSSAKANAAIEMKWAELLEKEIPQELHKDIQSQMHACNAIISSKDALINDFQQQLRAKDEEYVRTLRQQTDDTDDLLIRIRKEFSDLQHEYEKELDAIEEAYIEERERFIGEHTAEIENLFEIRKNKEIFYKENKQKNEEQYQFEIEETITKGADQYNKLKIELEMNIQALKQQLEEIRATYQLNTEKLDYNYRVLTELDVEKNAELARSKRRLNKLKEQLNVLIAKYNDMESVDAKTNHELTEDYRSLTLKYKDLQAKFRHFEIADTTKYDEVWAMHEEEVKDLVDQLLKADKIISEQQLGWKWKSPDAQALQQILNRHGGLNILASGINPDGTGSMANPLDPNINNTNTLQTITEEDNPEVERTVAAEAEAINLEKSRKVAGTRVRAMLELLVSEAGFMINPQVRQVVDSLPLDEAEITQAENMLKALGVKSESQLNTLMTYFFKVKIVSEEMTGIDSTETDNDYEVELSLKHAPEEVIALKDLIKPQDVIAAVSSYIEDVSAEGPMGAPSAVSGASGKSTQEEIRIAQKRLANMRNYWTNLSQIVSDDAVEVWHQLDGDYNAVRELLGKRAGTIGEVDELSKKNAELKRLLNQYLGDTVTNSAFKVPPAQVMKVRDVTSSLTMKGAKSMISPTGGLNDSLFQNNTKSKTSKPAKGLTGGVKAVNNSLNKTN